MRRCQLEECRAACCLYGVWLDEAEWQDIQAHAALIAGHMPADLRDPAWWLDGRTDADPHSRSGRVVHSRVLPDGQHYGGSACVFLREDCKCALQVAGQAAGCHPWRFKPFYCILHPLDLDEQGRITLDRIEELLTEAGSCLRAHRVEQPLVKVFESELRYLLGDQRYDEICLQVKEG
jgi:hypothetical protein